MKFGRLIILWLKNLLILYKPRRCYNFILQNLHFHPTLNTQPSYKYCKILGPNSTFTFHSRKRTSKASSVPENQNQPRYYESK